MKWQLRTIGKFYECGEDAIVYFDPASGDTHLISDFAAHLLQQLAHASAPLNIEQIIALVAEDVEPEDLPEFSQAIPGLLNELVDLDIVAHR